MLHPYRARGRFLRGVMVGLIAVGLTAVGLANVFGTSHTTTARAQAVAADRTLTERIEQRLVAEYPPDEPGATVLATHHGEVIFRGAYGLAHVELQVPMTPETTFCLASVTKPITAVGMMILVQDEEIFLDEPVTDYIPNLKHADGVTIEHLLSHTSGIPDMGSIPGYMADQVHRPVSPDDLIATVEDLPLEFYPGDRFEYSNANYGILARIIELVSEQSWEDFLKERLFDPAGMKSTYFGGHARILPNSATGYSYNGQQWQRSRFLSYTRGYGLGGLFSNVDDLSAWHQILFSEELLTQDTLEEMFRAFELNDGQPGRYGYGFFVREVVGRRCVFHGGGIFGWRTFVAFFPDDELFVSVLTNREGSGGTGPEDMVFGIAGMVLDDAG